MSNAINKPFGKLKISYYGDQTIPTNHAQLSPANSNQSFDSVRSQMSDASACQRGVLPDHYFIEPEEDNWSMDGDSDIAASFKPLTTTKNLINKGENVHLSKSQPRRSYSRGKQRKNVKKNRVFYRKMDGFVFYAFAGKSVQNK